MPALRSGALEGSESWFITAMLPGNRPFDALAGALDRITVKPSGEAVEGLRTGSGRLQDTISDLLPGDIQLVLIVDQFEELYTHVDDEQVRKRFLDLMADVGSATNHLVRVVATMRADFYDRPLLHAEFGRLVADRTVVVHSPSPADLEEMIRGPASQVGLTITDDLVQALAEDAGTQPGALPLLQHALSEVFEARHTDSLDLRQYRASGGLVGSIGRHAEHIFGGFNSDERRLTREAFLRLVTVDEESDDTRRQVRRSGAGADPGAGWRARYCSRLLRSLSPAGVRSRCCDPGTNRRDRPRGLDPPMGSTPTLGRRGSGRSADAPPGRNRHPGLDRFGQRPELPPRRGAPRPLRSVGGEKRHFILAPNETAQLKEASQHATKQRPADADADAS